jgi:hypothetical protein
MTGREKAKRDQTRRSGENRVSSRWKEEKDSDREREKES